MTTRITGVNVVRIDRIDHDVDVLLRDGTIAWIGSDTSRSESPGKGADAGAAAEAAGEAGTRTRAGEIADEVIDGSGRYLAPGYIDLHFHGADHYLVDRGPDDLASLCAILPRYGVAGFLPSVVPQPQEQHRALVESLANGTYSGTRVIGFFLEGPFLKLTGALPPEALEGLSANRIEELKAAASPYPAVFAAAPDVDGAVELIPLMAKNAHAPGGRAPVFITHTAATVAETQAGIEAGISHATHFYDVFPCPEESDPGVRPCGAVEAILADPTITVDFILDGEHVDPVAVQMALQTKGAGGVTLVTDANIGAGLPPGVYRGIGGEVEFAYPGAPARMTKNAVWPGCLAGSGLTMDRAVRNAVKLAGLDLVQAVRMASANPAAVLHIGHQTGSIDPGKRADVVLLDEGLEVERTWVGGESVFDKSRMETEEAVR